MVVALAAPACRLEVGYEASRYECSSTGACPEGMTCSAGFCSSAGADAPPGEGPADAGDADAEPAAQPDAGAPAPDASPASPDASPASADAAPPGCLLGNIADDFATSAPAPFWTPFVPQPPAVATQIDGRLVVALATGTSGLHYAGYTYASDTDGRGQRIQVEMVQTPNASSKAHAFFKVQNGDHFANQAGFLVQAGRLNMDTTDGAGAVLSHMSIVHNSTAHRFLALAEANGMVVFSTSPDGVAWTVRAQAAAPFPFEHARVSLGAGTWQAEAAPGSARFDNLGSGPATDCLGNAP